MKTKNPHIGESFESFLREDGIYDEVTATAIKRTLALKTPWRRATPACRA
ncbi:hypothetical protein [Inquilinus sp. CA228]